MKRAALGVVLAACGCIRALPGEDPPAAARLYYPGRMALSQDGRTAFVVNLNFDQRFNTSWLTTIDVPDLIARATSHGDPALALGQGLHVPGLGGDLVFNPSGTRAYLAHRGSGLLTVMDARTDPAAGTLLSCGTPDTPGERNSLGHFEAHTDCDLQHLMRLKDAVLSADGSTTDPNARQYDDPYAVTILPKQAGDTPGTAIAVGYLGAGRISLLNDDGSALPSVEGFIKTPARGISRLLATDDGLLFAASKARGARSFDADATKSYVVGVSLRDANTGLMDIAAMQATGGLETQSFALSTALGGLSRTLPSGISGLIAAPNTKSRLMVLSQQPDAVTLMDVSRPPMTSLLDDGTVAVDYPNLGFALMGAQTVAHSTLSDVVYVPRSTSDLVVVTSLTQDTLYFFDPTDQDLHMVYRMTLPNGQGPVGLLPVSVGGKDYLLVTTFFDHGLTVIDISATNYTDFTVLTSFHDESFAAAPRVR